MKRRIDPKVDCVFKAILGKEENKNLLIHFINAVLEPAKDSLIRDVTIKNPYNEKEFVGDKLSVVDVKATDEKGNIYQIEIQLALHPALASRILFTWSSIYHSQIQEGEDYSRLKPVISIWLLDGNLFPEAEDCHLSFSLYNRTNKIVLTDDLAIHVLQLAKWKSDGTIKTEKDRWICLFREGKNTDPDNPPENLNTPEMRQVMKVLNRFSENENDYLLYQSRMDAILLRNTWLRALEEARNKAQEAEKEKLKAQKKAQKTEKEAKERVRKAEKEAKKAEKEAEKKLRETEKKLRDLQLLLKQKGIKLPEDES